jgi:hypothetical protein
MTALRAVAHSGDRVSAAWAITRLRTPSLGFLNPSSSLGFINNAHSWILPFREWKHEPNKRHPAGDDSRLPPYRSTLGTTALLGQRLNYVHGIGFRAELSVSRHRHRTALRNSLDEERHWLLRVSMRNERSMTMSKTSTVGLLSADWGARVRRRRPSGWACRNSSIAEVTVTFGPRTEPCSFCEGGHAMAAASRRPKGPAARVATVRSGSALAWNPRRPASAECAELANGRCGDGRWSSPSGSVTARVPTGCATRDRRHSTACLRTWGEQCANPGPESSRRRPAKGPRP